MVAVKGWKFIY